VGVHCVGTVVLGAESPSKKEDTDGFDFTEDAIRQHPLLVGMDVEEVQLLPLCTVTDSTRGIANRLGVKLRWVTRSLM
jgi:hypothetical protein